MDSMQIAVWHWKYSEGKRREKEIIDCIINAVGHWNNSGGGRGEAEKIDSMQIVVFGRRRKGKHNRFQVDTAWMEIFGRKKKKK